jgi:hypothetical protein
LDVKRSTKVGSSSFSCIDYNSLNIIATKNVGINSSSQTTVSLLIAFIKEFVIEARIRRALFFEKAKKKWDSNKKKGIKFT